MAGGSAGQVGTSDFAVARFNTKGGFDTTFGNAGKVITPFANASAGIRVVVRHPTARSLRSTLFVHDSPG